MGIARMMNVDTSFTVATSKMLDVTQRWNSQGNFLNRYVTSRAIGMSVSLATLADAVAHLGLATAKLTVALSTGTIDLANKLAGRKAVKWNLNHCTVKESMIHLLKVVGYVAATILGIVAAFVSPKYLQIRGMVALGLAEQPKALQDGRARRFAKAAGEAVKAAKSGAVAGAKKMVPSKRTALITAAVVGTIGAGVGAAHYLGYTPTRAQLDSYAASAQATLGGYSAQAQAQLSQLGASLKSLFVNTTAEEQPKPGPSAEELEAARVAQQRQDCLDGNREASYFSTRYWRPVAC